MPVTPVRAWARRSRQALGAALVVLAFVPIYRLMDTSQDAPHRRVSVEVAEVTLQLAWWGTIVTLLLAWLLARMLPSKPVRDAGRAFMTWLSKPSATVYAATLSGIARVEETKYDGHVMIKSNPTNASRATRTFGVRRSILGRNAIAIGAVLVMSACASRASAPSPFKSQTRGASTTSGSTARGAGMCPPVRFITAFFAV